MNRSRLSVNLKTLRQTLALAGLACGSLAVAIAPLTRSASAIVPSAMPNCPSILYKEPFTSRVAVPDGCPPNVYQQQAFERDSAELSGRKVPAETTPVRPRTAVEIPVILEEPAD